jgi:hypothetical protein
LKYDYPPDQEPAATQLILKQAEVIAGDGVEAESEMVETW